jgi:hypothetical protein
MLRNNKGHMMSTIKRDTIDMAREADLVYFSNGRWWMDAGELGDELKAFEALVRADERSVEREQDIQRLSALVRAQQITIDKLEAQQEKNSD